MEDSKLKIELNYADENGKLSKKEFMVKINKPKLNNKYSLGMHVDKALTYDVSFSLVIPDHYHKALAGTAVAQKDITGALSQKGTRSYEKDFSKTLNCGTLSALTTSYLQIYLDYRWVKHMETAQLKKVIFYNFDNEFGEECSTWNGNPFGEKSKLAYQFAIGYTKDDDARYNFEKKPMDYHYDKEFYKYKVIEWSQEREDFFTKLQQSFVSMCEKINTFESNLNEDTINSFISNNQNLLG